ncbi:MAG TPA: hypothetical protein VFW13_02150, partial [Phenylobacterium sp.]|nr:hypothetical protein [Phenylobacterium sp.]
MTGLAPVALAETPSPAATQTDAQVLVMLRLAPEHFRPSSSYGGGYGQAVGLAARQRIAARLAKEHGLNLVSGWPMPVLGVDCFVMAVPSARSPDEVASA